VAPVPVNVYKTTREKVVYYDSYPATVVALKEVELRGEVSGYITGIYFKEGQPVKEGQKLYEIDRRNYQANYDQAKNSVEIAQANLEKAQRDAKRYTELNKQESISKQLFDDAHTILKNAELQLQSARAGLQRAESDLSYSVIHAPFDGTIGISQVRIGTLVIPGQTLLNTISSDNPIGVDFVVNAEEILRFQQIEKKKTSDNDSLFRISLPDHIIYPFTGKINAIDRAFNPQTGTIVIRLEFSNRERILKPGMSCDILAFNRPDLPQVFIPFKAVVEQMGEYFVYQVSGDQAKQMKITTGRRIGSNIIVTQGLNSGAIIVTDGVQKLHDGSMIITDESDHTVTEKIRQ
jgi:membrane fusion protein (multidrug efflux system)